MFRPLAKLAALFPSPPTVFKGSGIERYVGQSACRFEARGRPGPALTILGGVHGNELVGIAVVEKLLEAMAELAKVKSRSRTEGAVMRGSLTLAIGNPAAVARKTRGSQDHADLNRCFGSEVVVDFDDNDDDDGGAAGSGIADDAERARARLLAPLLAASDILVDLHATNKPSPPFIRVGGAFGERHFAACQHFLRGPGTCSKLVLDPHYTIAAGRSRRTSL